MGTVDYVAPEQIRGDDLDGRADQYALGCLLFELLTGTLPFMPGSDVAVVFAHLQEPPPRASARNPDLPAAVDGVLQRALAKDPAAALRRLPRVRRRLLQRRSASPRTRVGEMARGQPSATGRARGRRGGDRGRCS